MDLSQPSCRAIAPEDCAFDRVNPDEIKTSAMPEVDYRIKTVEPGLTWVFST